MTWSRDQSGRMGNIPAGTTIDAIENVYGYPANEIQNLTYQLCHEYTRWTSSVPNPAYYAHLVTSTTRPFMITKQGFSYFTLPGGLIITNSEP